MDDIFQGTRLMQASREFARYPNSPEVITPVELMEWAIDCCQWKLAESDFGSLHWFGPSRSPSVGEVLIRYSNTDMALATMRDHYSIWWSQKELYLAGQRALLEKMAAIEELMSKEKEPEKEEKESDGGAEDNNMDHG